MSYYEPSLFGPHFCVAAAAADTAQVWIDSLQLYSKLTSLQLGFDHLNRQDWVGVNRLVQLRKLCVTALNSSTIVPWSMVEMSMVDQPRA